MSQKPEGRFKARVGKAMTEYGVYHQSLYTPYSNGTPDQYFEGRLAALTIEFKWYQRKIVPGQTHILVDITKQLSALQKDWILRARTNGQRAWVCVALSRDYVVVDHNGGLKPGMHSYELISFANFCRQIYLTTGASLWLLSHSPSSSSARLSPSSDSPSGVEVVNLKSSKLARVGKRTARSTT